MPPPALPMVAAQGANYTLDTAQDLGDLNSTGGALLNGTLGNSTLGAAEVDWYSFTLTDPSAVSLSTLDPHSGSPLAPVLSLYNGDPFDFGDPYDPLFHRLLAQADGSSNGQAIIERNLAAGTYYVAVSGSGDRYFHPFLAGSGYPGSTGSYDLQVTANDLDFGPDDGPAVLATDPASGAVLPASPFELYVNFSTPIDFSTVSLGDNVRLTFNPNGTFGDSNDQDVPLANANPSTVGDELQLQLQAPLAPGYYQLYLRGDSSSGQQTLLDANDAFSLGATADHPQGSDFTLTFQVSGAEGQTGGPPTGDDTPATAHPLGDVTAAGLVQVSGAIGDDPSDGFFNPADVDLYHFTINGSGQFALASEVFARRMGAPLDPALSLYEFSPSDQQLHLVAVNDDTRNDTPATNGSLPLFRDAALFAGLTAGDYYLAVSSSRNFFDPTVAHSGTGGNSTGDYVLEFLVQADNVPPRVIAVTPPAGTALDAPPTQFVVQFSEPVNLQQLAYAADLQETSAGQLTPVYVQAIDGTRYYPRLVAFDSATNQATFLMLDALPNGSYQFHLSGGQGLTDFAGNLLVGNNPTTDYVVAFTVNAPPRGTAGDPLAWTDRGSNNALDQPQILGTLFPHELQAGVTITHAATPAPADATEYYQFEVLQDRQYFFGLSGSDLPSDEQLLTLYDASGNMVPVDVSDDGQSLLAALTPGTYVIQVGQWPLVAGEERAYRLQITLGGSGNENPTPLTVGPAPVLRIRLAESTPPANSAGDSAPVSMPTPTQSASGVASQGTSQPAPTGGSGPGSAPATSLPAVASVPSGVLHSLGASPLGGVRGPDSNALPTVAGPFLVGVPVFLPDAGLVQLAVFFQAEGASGMDGPQALWPEPAEAVGEAIRLSMAETPVAGPELLPQDLLILTTPASSQRPELHAALDPVSEPATVSLVRSEPSLASDAPSFVERTLDGKWHLVRFGVLAALGTLAAAKLSRWFLRRRAEWSRWECKDGDGPGR